MTTVLVTAAVLCLATLLGARVLRSSCAMGGVGGGTASLLAAALTRLEGAASSRLEGAGPARCGVVLNQVLPACGHAQGTVFELDKHLPPVNDRILEGAR
eukprot:360380-Chlamydomonas_euryale.AAC.6